MLLIFLTIFLAGAYYTGSNIEKLEQEKVIEKLKDKINKDSIKLEKLNKANEQVKSLQTELKKLRNEIQRKAEEIEKLTKQMKSKKKISKVNLEK